MIPVLVLLAPIMPQSSASLFPTPPDAELLGGRRFAESRLERRVRARVEAGGVAADYEDLLGRLAKLAEQRDRSRASAVDLVRRRPFRLPSVAEWIAEGFESEGRRRPDPGSTLVAAIDHARAVLDLSPPEDQAPALQSGLAPEAHLDALEALLARAAGAREAAFAPLSSEEREHCAAHWRELSERFEAHIDLTADEDPQRLAQNRRTVFLAEQCDRAALLEAARTLAAVADPAWLAGLAKDLAAAGLDLSLPIVLQRKTPQGRIVIAGTGDDVHRGGEQSSEEGPDELIAILIDLGGDDLYAGGQGSTVNQTGSPVLPAAILVDVAGNDAYESTHAHAQGAGLLGVGLLVDLAGDDSYVGMRWAQGTGFLGVGVLLDAAGDDVYRCLAYGQGLGLWGVGLSLDLGGDDRRESHLFAQGVGLAGGLGVLADRDGDDEAWCKGLLPTSYGTAGVFEGWGQGCGIGFRGIASGGIGVLVDGGGRDCYEGGNFSQGGGYYHALGLLIDRGSGDDRYIGSRYNQGFSAHQALGYFHEEGGNDLYRTRNAVAHGLAWDESVTFFVEDLGDDDYQGGGFSLGASAHNALCVFRDRRGHDTYRRGEPGSAGPNDYHGGTSLSFFLDEGGAKDAYPGEHRNDSVHHSGEHGFLVDR